MPIQMKKILTVGVILVLFVYFSGCFEENKVPTADFSVSHSTVGVQFTDSSTDRDGEIVKWHWDFGDGNISDERNPTHLFKSEGYYKIEGYMNDEPLRAGPYYNVTLGVTDDKDSKSSVTRAILVLEEPPLVPLFPVANFTYNPTEGITNQTLILFNASGSEIYDRDVTYYWDFGDGINITETNITTTHKYASVGVYAVNLTLKDELDLSGYITKDITVI